MTDEAAFLAAIIAAPDDDTPRLVYTDWLDEQGRCERSEFIRVQCRLAAGYCLCNGYGPCDWCALRRREGELLLAPHGDSEWTNRVAWFEPFRRNCQAWEYRRGFVAAVTCTADDWLRHGDAITAAQPIEAVTLTTDFDPQDIHAVIHEGRIALSFAGREMIHDRRKCSRRDGWMIPDMLRAEWPRVKTWTLPTQTQIDFPSVTGQYLNPIIERAVGRGR